MLHIHFPSKTIATIASAIPILFLVVSFSLKTKHPVITTKIIDDIFIMVYIFPRSFFFNKIEYIYKTIIEHKTAIRNKYLELFLEAYNLTNITPRAERMAAMIINK